MIKNYTSHYIFSKMLQISFAIFQNWSLWCPVKAKKPDCYFYEYQFSKCFSPTIILTPWTLPYKIIIDFLYPVMILFKNGSFSWHLRSKPHTSTRRHKFLSVRTWGMFEINCLKWSWTLNFDNFNLSVISRDVARFAPLFCFHQL